MFGLDATGKLVNAPASTLDISRQGMRIDGVRNWQRPGEIIGVRYGPDKARYQIVWVGAADTPQQGQMGLKCVEAKVLWGTELEQSAAAAAGSYTGRLRAPSVLGPSTGSFSAPAEGLTTGSKRPHPQPAPSKPTSRRRNARYVVEGGVQVREQGASSGQWATVRDISLGGCYIETTSPLRLDARVEAALQIGEYQFNARGVVANVDPMTGMGIRFTDLTPTDRARLEALVATLAQKSP